jgi:tetratricopeptide (TPR) repeat protein
MATPGHTHDQPLAKQRRFKMAKAAIAIFFILLLLSAGLQGRRHARLQARFDDITQVRDQLQQKLDDEQRPTEQLAAGLQGTKTSPSRPPLSNPQVTALVRALQARLDQLNRDYGPGKLTEAESWEIRLSQATLANAEQRFAEALKMIPAENEKVNPAGATAAIVHTVRVLQIRGDSFYGLHEWGHALDHYRPLLTLTSNRLATIARVAECYAALGRTNEALTTYAELAKSHSHRGDAFLTQGRSDAALPHYAKAIEIQTRLIEQAGRSGLANELAMSHRHRGDTFLLQGKSDAALPHYAKAIEIQTPLIEQAGRSELAMSHHQRGDAFLVQGKSASALGHYEKALAMQVRLVKDEGRSELANDMARSHGSLGNSLLAQRKLDAALGHYGEAIEIQTRLIEQEGRIELTSELAESHNNRGVVRRAQGKLDAAIGDFDHAIQILSRLDEQEGQSERVMIRTPRGLVPRAQVKLVVAMGYSENALEALVRARLIERGRRSERAVVLAASLKNRAYTHLVQGKPDAALSQLKSAVEIYARLVEQDGETDLSPQFAKSLGTLAWIYATNPDHSFRDGRQAKRYALKACELSEWKAFAPLEALAAACAETGNFVEALKWQERALELAPGKDKVEIRTRLELYKIGKPYRAE